MIDENVKNEGDKKQSGTYQSLYETQKRHLKDFCVYLVVFLIAILCEALNFPPKYKLLFATGVTVLLITVYNLLQKRQPNDTRPRKIRTNIVLLVVSTLTILGALGLNIPTYDIFISDEERLLREYYEFMDRNIVGKGKEIEVTDLQNGRAIDYLTEQDRERWASMFAHHNMETEYHKLYTNRICHDILYIKKSENVDQNIYKVVMNVHEYVLGDMSNGTNGSEGDTLGAARSTDRIVSNLKKYFKMESTAEALRESSVEDNIRTFLDSSEGRTFLSRTSDKDLLWVLGSRFKLKLKEPNLNIASRGNERQYIETRWFVVYPRERKIEGYDSRGTLR